MEKYMLIMPSGEIRWKLVEPAERMKRFYEIIGTDCVENVYTILPDICIIVDEYGKLKNPPQQYNVWASLLYAGFLLGRDYIAGPAIVAAIHLVDGESDWVPLNQEEEEKLRSMGLYPGED